MALRGKDEKFAQWNVRQIDDRSQKTWERNGRVRMSGIKRDFYQAPLPVNLYSNSYEMVKRRVDRRLSTVL